MTGGWDEIVVRDLDVMAEFSRVRVEVISEWVSSCC